MGSRVTHGSGGGQETGRRKRCCLKQEASSMVVPEEYYQDTKNIGCRCYDKRSWPKRKRQRIRTIGLTVLGP
jgi:hypothetical protein